MSKTAEGLRDRLFDVLDGLIRKEIKPDEVEAICYTSEQILKTAQVELDIARERNNAVENERKFQLELQDRQNKAVNMLEHTIEEICDV